MQTEFSLENPTRGPRCSWGMIIKWMLEIYGVRVWTGFKWLSVGSNGLTILSTVVILSAQFLG